MKKSSRRGKKRCGVCFWYPKGKLGKLRRPMRAMTVDKIINVTYTRMILHNMILKEDEHAFSLVHIRVPVVEPVFNNTVLRELMDQDMHFRFRNDLVLHLAAQNLSYLEEESEDVRI
ncbi:hypothetical protein HanPI659440_Chr10g0388321 [Helianthus annuus]|nr:hypothetical protein HanPI659440_Chr10g0388321 [Helianthus annuus]